MESHSLRKGAMPKRTLAISSKEAHSYLSVLSSETRLAILELLGSKILNVQQIADALGLSQPTVSSHVQKLEEAGLIATNFERGQRGTQKACSSLFDEITVILASEKPKPRGHVLELNMPLGAYTHHEVSPTCGLAYSESIIGLLDSPKTFYFPERMNAEILWFAKGFVEYTFACSLPPGASVTRLDFSAEICSEVMGWDNDWASDITLWVGNTEVGTWTCPGDFGGERGRLNPRWWQDRYSQFGLLKNWMIDASGSYIDGVKLSSLTLADLTLDGRPLQIRLGTKSDARNPGGVTLFGETFGNYEQNLILHLTYELAGESSERRSDAPTASVSATQAAT